MSLLERIRTQPQRVKSQIALVGASTLTLLIALVWMTTVPARIGEMKTVVNADQSSEAASVIDGFGSFIERVDEEKSVPQPAPADPYKNSALNSLENWNEQSAPEHTPERATTSAEIPPEGGNTMPQNSTSTSSSEFETREMPTVILIGTTTKNTQ